MLNEYKPVYAPAVLTPEQLASERENADVRILDASWYLPAEQRDPKLEYAQAHIPGAIFFDIDLIADADSPLPHMLPRAEDFAARMEKMGLEDDSRIIVYDGHGLMSAPRVWWMLRVFGHHDVSVLNGGLPAWRAAGLPVVSSAEDKPITPAAGRFSAHLDRSLLRSMQQMYENLDSRSEQVVDARSAGRFAGNEAEPRAGLRAGHIPGSFNVPFASLLDAKTRSLLTGDELAQRFQAAGVDLSAPISTTCGSGVSACVLALALYSLGREDVAVYDGSWSEWGAAEAMPIEKSAP